MFAGLRFNHIGFVVSSIEELVGADRPNDIFVDETQGVRLIFVNWGGITVELLEPLDAKSPLASSLKKGMRLVHLCFEATQLELEFERLKRAGFVGVSSPKPAVAFAGRRVAFLYSRIHGVLELVESKARLELDPSELH